MAIGGVNVSSVQANTHSFVVKVWLEETGEEAGQAVWRGRVTHVPSGKAASIRSLGEIGPFILPYLLELGVRPTWSWRLRRWAQCWLDRVTRKRE